MVNFEVFDKEKNYAMLSFSTMQMPSFTVNKQKGYVEFGKKNDFPNQLLRLYEEHAEHAAIVGSKANYLLGEGLKAKEEVNQPTAEQFLSFANRFEDWNQLNDKIKVDCELFNGFYLQVITDLTGKPKEFYHLHYANCRLSEDKNTLYFSDNFNDKKIEPQTWNKYVVGKVGVYFIHFEYYKPTPNKLAAVYPLPQYIGGIKDISTDIDISTFNNNYVANGFSAGTLITFFNGDPTPEQKREIKRRLLETHTSPEKAGSVVINYADKDGQAAQISALSVDDLDKKFEFTSKRALDKILRSHNVTNPELFGVKTEGQLGTRVSLSESYELMINTYTKPRQNSLLRLYSDLCFLVTGQKIDFEIKQLKPIGLDLTNDADLTQDERRALKGYEPLTAPKVDVNGQPIVAESNDALRGLSAAENMDLMRVIRDYTKGKLNEHLAKDRIKAYGFTEDQANKYLGIESQQNFSAHEDLILKAFLESAEDIDEDCEILFEEDAHIHNSSDALKLEIKHQKMYFASALEISVTDLDNAILNAIKGNPTITIEDLKKQLQVSEEKINESIARLTEKQLISGVSKSWTVSPKALNKETEPVVLTEIKTVYRYVEKTPTPPLKGKSREFCKRMMEKSASKGWSFEKIDNISNEFGLSAWDYRGGYWTNADTGETTPYCRHIWKAQTIKVKKK
jgi:DNA-binding Lrp family transcriptional regulator